VTRLRDDPTEFEGALDAAARELGLAPLFVEKDYWVTQVLRALNVRHPGWFVFKGGTSLSKGYGLIERFSEDVDILVAPAKDDSARTRGELLLAMTESVAAELELDWQPGRAPGRGKMAHRADVLVYPRTVRGSAVVPMEDRGVLLETGFAGGDYRLLDHQATKKALQDRGTFERILSEMQDISVQHFGGFTERPASGYADSPAFSPDAGSELRGWLEARYAEASALMPARTTGRWPRLGQIMARVAESRALL
jgi:hypothetical protein